MNRDGSNLRNIVKVGVGPSWSPDGRWLYYTPRLPGGLFKIGVEGGTPETVRTDKLRNLIGADGTTAFMVFERTLVDGLPVFEIHAASPENGPSHVLAQRVALAGADLADLEPKPVTRWKMDRDGAGRRIQHEHLGALDIDGRMASDHGLRRTADVHRSPGLVVIGWTVGLCSGGRRRRRHLPAGRIIDWRTRLRTLRRIAGTCPMAWPRGSDRPRLLLDCRCGHPGWRAIPRPDDVAER